MDLTNQRVLVTGAGGFIGSHLVEELVNRGAIVRAFVHYNSRNDWGHLERLPKTVIKEVEIVSGDIVDARCVEKAVRGCDVLFHLAALIGIPYSYRAPESYVLTNITGTLNVLNAALECGVQKMVHTSTSETYGTARYTPIDEEHPLQGQSPYSASKIGADKLAESYFRSFQLPVATIRPFNTYGPRQSARAVIPTIISQILAGQRRIRLGSQTPVRDFTFVKDTVEGFICMAQSERTVGETVNIGFGKGITIGDLARTITSLMEVSVDFNSDESRIRPENSEVMELICANARAALLANWQPRHSLESGLRETIGFIEKNLSLYKTDIYNV
jgi:NAD dependent epimerase/dehydratase